MVDSTDQYIQTMQQEIVVDMKTVFPCTIPYNRKLFTGQNVDGENLWIKNADAGLPC